MCGHMAVAADPPRPTPRQTQRCFCNNGGILNDLKEYRGRLDQRLTTFPLQHRPILRVLLKTVPPITEGSNSAKGLNVLLNCSKKERHTTLHSSRDSIDLSHSEGTLRSLSTVSVDLTCSKDERLGGCAPKSSDATSTGDILRFSN